MSAKITKALHEVMSKVGYVQKTGKNSFHGYKYAGEADLLEKLRPAMLEAGLLLIPSVTEVSPVDDHGITTVRMEYTLVHKDGEVWPQKIGAAGAGSDKNKNGVGDKGLYKAITGANKYLLFKLFQIETGDDPETDDAEAVHNGSVIPKSAPTSPVLSEPNATEVMARLRDDIVEKQSVGELKAFATSDSFQHRIGALPERHRQQVRACYEVRLKDLKKAIVNVE